MAEWSGRWDAAAGLPACKHGVVVSRSLKNVDRADHPGGRSRGPPGQPVESYISIGNEDAKPFSFAEILAEGSQYVLYSIEQVKDDITLVFLKLKPAARRTLYEAEPFIDRGLRKLAEVGSSLAFCSLSTAEAYLSEAATHFDCGGWRLAFVWNCGRCGSTLLHKAVLAHGGVSLSEPHWLDQLLKGSAWQASGAIVLERAVRACTLVEVLLARRQRSPTGWTQSTFFSFNPKAGYAAHVQEAVARAFPLARHIFMYRACHRVVDSFVGLLDNEENYPTQLRQRIAWWWYGQALLPQTRVGRLKDCLTERTLPLAALSRHAVAARTLSWLESVMGWLNLKARCKREGEGNHALSPIGDAPSLRMDELTSTDLRARERVLRQAFVALGLLCEASEEESLDKALAVFGTNSQEGSAMGGPRKSGIAPGDEPLIHECVRIALDGLDGVTIHDGGANLHLPSSIGF